MDTIVAKFGGSSVKDAQAMQACVSVVRRTENLKIVVISATWDTTNLLEKIARAASVHDHTLVDKMLQHLYQKHYSIIRDLLLLADLDEPLKVLCTEAKNLASLIDKQGAVVPSTMDALYSIGERISSLILAQCLNRDFPKRHSILMDVRKILVTDDSFGHAKPVYHEIEEKAANELVPLLADPQNLIVTQGFIGQTCDGRTTTLGREGSDLSGALLAWAIGAREYHIWTDVPGVATCDPRMIANVKWIAEMSFDEAEIMAKYGAKVLFKRTMEPVKKKNIPVFVGATKDLVMNGTWIRPMIRSHRTITGIALKANQTCFRCVHNGNADLIDQIRRISQEYAIAEEFLRLSEDHFMIIADPRETDLLNLSRSLMTLAPFEKQDGLALISVIGSVPSEKRISVDDCMEKNTGYFFPWCDQDQAMSFLISSEHAVKILETLHDLLSPLM